MKIFVLVIFVVVCDVSFAFRWCCKSPAELDKCEEFRTLHTSSGVPLFTFGCVLGHATEECMDMIQSGDADLIDLDGGDVFLHRDNVTVVAAEDNGSGDASYFAVAVVKATARPDLTLFNLHGASTCHTGVAKTSGWNMPIGWMLRNGQNPAGFSASCAPGADSDAYRRHLPGGNPKKWCALCMGDGAGKHKCERDQDEGYYGYKGAFRCLTDGVGEVAFVKQSIPLESPNVDEFQLLCPDHGRLRAHPSQWQNCMIGKVPSHAVVMRRDTTAQEAQQVFDALDFAQKSIGPFNTFGGNNLLWGSKTTRFLKRDRMDPVTFIGREYFCNIFALHHGRRHPNC